MTAVGEFSGNPLAVSRIRPNSRLHRNLAGAAGFIYLALEFCRATRAAASDVSALSDPGWQDRVVKE
jgi:hypothetical protein